MPMAIRSQLEQQNLPASISTTMVKLFYGAVSVSSDVADPTKKGLMPPWNQPCFKLFYTLPYLKPLMFPLAFVEPLQFADNPLEEQLPTLNLLPILCMDLPKPMIICRWLKRPFSAQAYQEIVVDKKHLNWGNFSGRLKLPIMWKRLLMPPEIRPIMATFLAAEVLQGSLLNLINYANYHYIGSFG